MNNITFPDAVIRRLQKYYRKLWEPEPRVNRISSQELGSKWASTPARFAVTSTVLAGFGQQGIRISGAEVESELYPQFGESHR